MDSGFSPTVPQKPPWEAVVTFSVPPSSPASLHPYFKSAQMAIAKLWNFLIMGIIISVITYDEQALQAFLTSLRMHIMTYRLNTDKDKCLRTLKLMYLIMVKESQQCMIIEKAGWIIYDLLQSGINFGNLSVDWKALWSIYRKGKNDDNYHLTNLNAVFEKLKVFYTPESRKEIAEHLKKFKGEELVNYRRIFDANWTAKPHKCYSPRRRSNRRLFTRKVRNIQLFWRKMTQYRNPGRIKWTIEEKIKKRTQILKTKRNLKMVTRLFKELHALEELLSEESEITQAGIEKVDSVASVAPLSSFATQKLYKRFGEFIRFRPHLLGRMLSVLSPKLKSLLNKANLGEKQRSVTIGYARLAASILHTSTQSIMGNKDIVFETIGQLLNSKYDKVHNAGVEAISAVLFKLTRVYPILEPVVNLRKHSSTKSRFPFKKRVKWHIPEQTTTAVAEELMRHFVFPTFDVIRDETSDIKSLTRTMSLLKSVLEVARNCFPPPFGSGLELNPSFLPSCSAFSSDFTTYRNVITTPDGENVRDSVVALCEKLVDRIPILKKKQGWEKLVATIFFLLEIAANADESNDWEKFSDIHNISTVDTEDEEYIDLLKWSSNAENKFQYLSKKPCSNFLKRILKALVRISLLECQRYDFIGFLGSVCSNMEISECYFVCLLGELFSQELKDPKQLDGFVELRLEILRDLDQDIDDPLSIYRLTRGVQAEFVGSTIKQDLMKAINDFEAQRERSIAGELENFCNNWWKEQEKDGLWAGIKTEEDLEKVRDLVRQRQKEDDDVIAMAVENYEDYTQSDITTAEYDHWTTLSTTSSASCEAESTDRPHVVYSSYFDLGNCGGRPFSEYVMDRQL